MQPVIHEVRKGTIEDTILFILREGIRAILIDLGFHVANFSFYEIIIDPEFRRLILEVYRNTNVAKILIYAPDFFVMHARKNPIDGVFFVKCIPLPIKMKQQVNAIKMDTIVARIYNEFYPYERIMMVVSRQHDSHPLLASWMKGDSELQLNKMKDLASFIEQDLGCKANKELIGKLISEISKMYRQDG
jgi:hypothetical protein